MKNYSATESQTNFPEAPLLRMTIFGLILLSLPFLYGLNLSYPIVALSQMDLDLNEASWFGSTAIFTSPISSIVAGVIIDLFGRKTALLYCILPSIAGWSLQYYSSSMAAVIGGQILNGLTIGSVSYPVQVYAGECVMINNIRLRNSFMVWIAVASSLATLCMLLMANFLGYREICGICSAFSVVLLALFSVALPESPTWLHNMGRRGDAEWSQKKLGIAQPILTCQNFNDDDVVAAAHPFRWSSMAANLKKISRRDVYIPAVLVSITALLYEFSGGISAVTYMINIIDERIPGERPKLAQMPGNWEDRMAEETTFIAGSSVYSLVCGIAMCVGSLLSSFVIPYLGIKAGFIFSNIGNVVALVALTCSTTVIESSQTALIVRVTALTLMAFLLSVTLGPSMAAAGDIFPVDAKGFASIPDVVGYLAAGLSNKFFPYLYHAMAGYTYLVFAAFSIVCSIYVYFFAPEVVGKTLEEIHREFSDFESKKSKSQRED